MNSDIISTLNPVAAGTAESFLVAHPDAVLTSGCRLVDGQCQAMASNIAPAHLDWIAKTYRGTPVEAACQAWVTANPELAANVESCETGLLGVLAGFHADQLRELSWHLPTSQTGQADAFDVAPDGDLSKVATLKDLVAARVAEGGAGEVLTEEGGLTRWHCQIC